jgi:hypothetical protein
VHDCFAILGIAPGAPPALIRQATLRRLAAIHPDFRPAGSRQAAAAGHQANAGGTPADAAVDFIDMRSLVDRLEAAFFGSVT